MFRETRGRPEAVWVLRAIVRFRESCSTTAEPKSENESLQGVKTGCFTALLRHAREVSGLLLAVFIQIFSG